MPKRNYDWEKIKGLWEAGTTANAISKGPNMPSRQAICVKARDQGWTVRQDIDIGSLPVALGASKLTPENYALALEYARLGCPKTVVSQRLGINRDTLNAWLDREPQFRHEFEAAKAEHIAKQYQRIDSAADRDWKAADRLLQVNPLTKEDWGANQGGAMIGNTFNVLANFSTGIDRGKGKVIEHEDN